MTTSNPFHHWTEVQVVKNTITNPLIEVGNHTYYSGYYAGGTFEDVCVRYIWGDEKTKDMVSPEDHYGWTLDRIRIGRYCSLASGIVFMMGGNHNHRTDWITVFPFQQKLGESYLPKGDTIIGHDVWIGTEAMIMPGVTIGNGAIIAARAVVTKSVEPYTIVGGNPARLIRKRFTDAEIQLLQELEWWNWSDELVQEAVDVLSSPDISKLVQYYNDKVKPTINSSN